MKQGRFALLPERPADVRHLWRSGTPLDGRPLPVWLDADDAADFRLVAEVSLAGLDAAARAEADAEFAELELARLIVTADRDDADVHHIHVRHPVAEPVWSIGVCVASQPRSPFPPPADQPSLTADDVTDVPASSVADPFLIRHGTRWHMFLEVVNWRSWKGEIGLATSNDGLRWRYEQIVLAEPFHLSYPHVFAANGEIWMVPETSQAASVRLYRARRFPYDWEHVTDLLTGLPFADATVVEHHGRWWMFSETSGGRHDTLRLHHADALTGPWQEHAASPVIAGDATHARPAGRIVSIDGRLCQPVQNCHPAYGTDVRLRDIVQLDPVAYEEQARGDGPILGPAGRGWCADGMHHADLHQLTDGRWLAAVDGWRMNDEARA